MPKVRTLWLDAHLPVALAPWISRSFRVKCRHVGDVGLHQSDDGSIFTSARRARVILMTKDDDFIEHVELSGPPPQVLWLVCGNISLARLKVLLQADLAKALRLLAAGATIVRLGTPPGRAVRRQAR